MSLQSAVRALPGIALNALLPPRCLVCGAGVERPGTLCGPCWGGLTFLAPPFCAACGFPFDYDLGADVLCGETRQVVGDVQPGQLALGPDVIVGADVLGPVEAA